MWDSDVFEENPWTRGPVEDDSIRTEFIRQAFILSVPSTVLHWGDERVHCIVMILYT